MRLRISRQTAAPGSGPDAIAFRRAAVAIVLVAITARVLFCGLVFPHIGPGFRWTGVDDGFDDIASNLLDGHGFVFHPGGSPVLDKPPGYPYLLAGLFAATGTRTAEGWPLWIFQALLDGVTTLLIALYARRMFGSARIALLAAGAWALYPQIIVYSARPFSEVPFTLLLFLLALAVARLLRTGRVGDALLVGFLWGVSVLFKEKLLFLPLFILAVLWKRQHRRGRGTLAPALAAVVAMTVVVAPWMVRQHAAAGRWLPITARSGNAVHFGLDTDFSHPQVLTHTAPDSAATVPPPEIRPDARLAAEEADETSLTTGIAQIESNPLDYLKRVALKLVVFWYWGQKRVMPANAAVQFPLVALAILGVFLWRRRVDLTVPLMFILYFVGIHALTTVRMRYSLPIMPFVIVLAAAAADRLLARRSAAAVAAAALALAVPSGARAVENPDSLIASLAGSVHAAALRQRVEELSGERTVVIAGRADTLTDRYSASAKCRRAETYVAERFEEAGLDVTLEPYFGTTINGLARGDGYVAAVANGGGVLVSEDGDHWRLRNPPAHLLALRAILARGDTLWVGGDAGSLFRSVDAGRHWISCGQGGPNAVLGFAHAGGDTLWAVGDYGLLWRSTNGGLAWSTLPFPSSRPLTSVAPAPDGRLFASAYGSFYEGQADGTNWRVVPVGVSGDFDQVIFTPSGTGWLVGRSGAFYRSPDGGESWNAVNAGTEQRLYGISFRDDAHGIAVGWDGTVISTTDGGAAWEAVPSGTHSTLRAACDGVTPVVGGVATLLVSSNGAFAPPDSIEGSWRNVVATLPGQDRGTAYLLTAHLDNILYPDYGLDRIYGADDNASGVAVLLEAAPALARVRFQHDIRLVAFTGEEEGLLGSSAYVAAAEARGDSIAGDINLDMVAVNDDGIPAMDAQAGDDPRSLALAETYLAEASRVSPSLLPGIVTAGSTTASDHGSFWNRGYPALLLIEDLQGTPGDPGDPGGDFNPRLHTPADRVDTFDPAFHEAIARAAVATIAALAVPVGPRAADGVLLASSPPSPNPGRSFSFPIALSAAAAVTMEVFDVTGRRVRTMSWPFLPRASATLTWNACDAHGRRVPSGVYFYRIRAGGREATGRVVVAR